MKTLLTFLLLAVAASVCDAQWFWQNPLPTGNPIYAVSFIDANTGTVVGGGTNIRTTDGGASWTRQYVGVYENLHCVCFTDANTGALPCLLSTFLLLNLKVRMKFTFEATLPRKGHPQPLGWKVSSFLVEN